jgi:pimeloyl-ACP methyl ester carboxylesterase
MDLSALPVTLETALVHGRKAAFLRRRAPAGGPRVPVVLLHGAGGNRRSFDELCAALDEEEVIVPSLPGRGGSEGPAPATAAEAAGFVRDLLDALGIGACALIGHSYGGAVALEMALADAASARASIAGVILAASGARLRVHPAILERARAAAAGEGPPVDLRVAFQPETDPRLVQDLEERTAEVPPAAALADWNAANAFDRLGALGAIRAPLTALAGDRDALTPPKYAQYLAAGIPGATVRVIEGAGHMLPVEQPRAVVEALRALLAAR